MEKIACNNCSTENSELVSIIRKTTIDNEEDVDELSISAGFSHLVDFWLGETHREEGEDSPLLNFCPQCSQVFQNVYNVSLQFIQMTDKEGELCKKLSHLREQISTPRPHPRLRKRRQFSEIKNRKSSLGFSKIYDNPATSRNTRLRSTGLHDDDNASQKIREKKGVEEDDLLAKIKEESVSSDENEITEFEINPLKNEDSDDSSSQSDRPSRQRRSAKTPQRRIPCPVDNCDKTFARRDRFHTHLKNFHQDVNKKGFSMGRTYPKTVPCPIESCSKMFSRRHRLDLHLKAVHPQATSEEGGVDVVKKRVRRRLEKACPLCGKLVRSTNLQFHIRTHSNKKDFLCPQCGKVFRSNRNLKLHMLEVHGQKEDKHICPHCGISCSRKWSLDQHIRMKHETPAEKRFECQTCGKSYRQEPNFRQHMQMHTDERRKDFECPICSKVFARKENVKLHLKAVHK
ncbi:Zinc finger protein 26 [Folsomia candida]|uniref:Zinc finger protein 26 n=1 Tax=Folsomia candida TaxID=158441 RepID=A0A226CZ84_FOLCA|nr:Zinc finger protein 26 [Folsomia candida]